MKVLMVIEISEPLFEYSRFRKADQLFVLRASHDMHLLPGEIRNQPQVLWSRRNTGISALIPFLWASRPSVCGLAGRGIIVFPCCRRSELVLGSFHPLRWLEHGNVLRSYELFKVQMRESNVEGVELGDCETGSYPLVINGEKGG